MTCSDLWASPNESILLSKLHICDGGMVHLCVQAHFNLLGGVVSTSLSLPISPQGCVEGIAADEEGLCYAIGLKLHSKCWRYG